jgi:hypothetical protein
VELGGVAMPDSNVGKNTVANGGTAGRTRHGGMPSCKSWRTVMSARRPAVGESGLE